MLQADIATLYLEFPGGQQVGLPALDVIAAGVLSLGVLERSPSPVKGRAGSAGEQLSSAFTVPVRRYKWLFGFAELQGR